MKQIRLLVTGLLAILATSTLTGCMTFNSQTLDLHPQIQVSRVLSKEKRVEIIPKDLRADSVIGYRYTGKADAPSIVLKDSLHLLQHTTEHALEDMGIVRFYGGEFNLTISLIDLNYRASESKIKQTVNLDTKLKVTISKDNKSYTGTYTADKQQTFVGVPSEEENERLVNDLFSSVMNLAMNDQQLIDFIQFN
ncbi:YajG family lipoprotein [Neptuniibacter sp. QD48_11]|uniref:YajG family lipoprotein n=1 Tax=unclassified Neptuniibacter TaxID=2630693 RepID=UPI0039F5F7F7